LNIPNYVSSTTNVGDGSTEYIFKISCFDSDINFSIDTFNDLAQSYNFTLSSISTDFSEGPYNLEPQRNGFFAKNPINYQYITYYSLANNRVIYCILESQYNLY